MANLNALHAAWRWIRCTLLVALAFFFALLVVLPRAVTFLRTIALLGLLRTFNFLILIAIICSCEYSLSTVP